ncbi:MAG: TlpA family protein disulfide reductase [Acidobacteria bacterium]|nr:TlpA family protein disulfide reductase [Acidobacteriota bacterium]
MRKVIILIAALTIFAIGAAAQPSSPFVSDPNEPIFTAADMNGDRLDIRDFRGKVVVLNLWFINCPNCLAEIKLLNQLVDAYQGKDVVFLAPAASTKTDLTKFLAKNPFKYKVLPDAGNIIIGKFGKPDGTGNLSMPFPMHIVLNRDGRIITRAPGIKGIEAVKAELKKQFPG